MLQLPSGHHPNWVEGPSEVQSSEAGPYRHQAIQRGPMAGIPQAFVVVGSPETHRRARGRKGSEVEQIGVQPRVMVALLRHPTV